MKLQRVLAGVGLVALGGVLALVVVGFEEGINDQKRQLMQQGPVVVSPPIPRNLAFCGEPVPTQQPDVLETLEKQLLYNMYSPAATSVMLKRAARWRPVFMPILRAEGVPDDFFYLMVAESAIENARSYAGAQGFWQFMPETATEYGLEVNPNVDERNHPVLAAYAACAYLKKAYRRFGNWTNVAAAYNMGMGGVTYQMNRQRQMSYYDLYLNKETANYVFRILALKLVMESPEAYGFRIFAGDLYAPLPFREVPVDSAITNLVEFARRQGTNLKTLKLMNQWLVGDDLPNPRRKTYVFQFPANTRPIIMFPFEENPAGPLPPNR